MPDEGEDDGGRSGALEVKFAALSIEKYLRNRGQQDAGRRDGKRTAGSRAIGARLAFARRAIIVTCVPIFRRLVVRRRGEVIPSLLTFSSVQLYRVSSRLVNT